MWAALYDRLTACDWWLDWRLTAFFDCDAFEKSVAGFEALRRFSPKRRRVAIQCNFLRNFESFLIWFGHPQRSWNTHSWHFEILILNLSSSRFFLATILKCFNLKSSHCFLRVRHNEFVYIIFYIYHPPLIIIPIGQPLLQLFIREHFQIFGLRWMAVCLCWSLFWFSDF